MPQPFISVVMPVYNATHFLPDAIASIRAQDYEPLEIVLVDDGSTDDLDAMLGDLGDLVLLRQPNRGPSAARNLGMRAAKGEIIAFLDADDRWPEGKLRLQVDYLQQNPAIDVVLGYVKYILLEGSTAHEEKFVQEYSEVTGVLLGSGLYRRSVFDKVGVFDEKMRQGEDMDWFMRVRESGVGVTILPQVGLLYQRHTSNITRDIPACQGGVLDSLRKSLERRRRQAASAADLQPWTDYVIKGQTGQSGQTNQAGQTGQGDQRDE